MRLTFGNSNDIRSFCLLISNMISRGAKVALGGAFCFAAAVIFLVHQMQNIDRKRLKEGVIRDLERQEKKRRNVEELKEQIELTKKLQEQRDRNLNSEKME